MVKLLIPLIFTHLTAIVIGVILCFILTLSDVVNLEKQHVFTIKKEMIQGRKLFYAEGIKFMKTKYKGLYLAKVEEQKQ